jgi:hypothetical protein
MIERIGKIYEEIRYYEDIIKQKRENENQKRNHQHPFKIEDFVLYAPKKIKELSRKLMKPWI